MVRLWLAPAVSRLGRAMMTEVVVGGLAACLRMMRRGFLPEAPREASSDGPRGYNAGADDVVGSTVFGAVRNFDGGTAPHLCASFMGATPSYG